MGGFEALDGIAARQVGEYRSVHFATGSVDPVADRLDLLIVGLPEITRASQIGGIVCKLDAALSGTLSHLRAGGVFEGRFGETLILSSPPSPVKSRSLLIMGMGDADKMDSARFGSLAAVAMRTAAQLDSHDIACLLGPLAADAAEAAVASAARAMMTAVLGAIDEQHDRRGSKSMNWIFDLRASCVDVIAEQLKTVLRQWDF